MLNLEPKFVKDYTGKTIAVQLDLDAYLKVEELLEDIGLYRLMQAAGKEEMLTLSQAKAYYQTLRR